MIYEGCFEAYVFAGMDGQRVKRNLWRILAAAIVCAVLGLAYLQHRMAREFEMTLESVIDAKEILLHCEQFLSALKDVETGHRGYLLTGKDSYLEPYHMGRSDSQRALTNLMMLTGDTPSQQKRLQQLQALAENRVRIAEEGLALRRTKGLDAAVSLVLTDDGKVLMDQIRSLVKAVQLEEQRLLTKSQGELQLVVYLTRIISLSIIAMLAGAAAWVWILIRKVQRMTEIVTICAWTSQVKLDGKWVPLEQYLRQRLGFITSHGLSEEAARELAEDVHSKPERKSF
jgi:CHASE3 domain sensor protein